MGAVRDPQDRTNWKWINGNDVTVSFWNLPGGNDDCARYDGSKGWLWSDTNCNVPINFICQHRKYCYALNFKVSSKLLQILLKFNLSSSEIYLFLRGTFQK